MYESHVVQGLQAEENLGSKEFGMLLKENPAMANERPYITPRNVFLNTGSKKDQQKRKIPRITLEEIQTMAR